MGITHKTDGKSTADGKMSDKYTQRSNEDDSYSESDPNETIEHRKEQLGGPRFYFFFGVIAIIVGLMYLFSLPSMDLKYERDLVYKRMEEREEDTRRFEQERMKSRVGPFREAWFWF